MKRPLRMQNKERQSNVTTSFCADACSVTVNHQMNINCEESWLEKAKKSIASTENRTQNLIIFNYSVETVRLTLILYLKFYTHSDALYH